MFDKEDVSALFKDVFPEKAQDQLKRAGPLALLMKRTSKGLELGEGDDIFAQVPVILGENPGFGARPYMTAMPDPETDQTRRAKAKLRYNYVSGIIPGPSMKVKEKQATFGANLTMQVHSATLSAKRDYSRQWWGDGTGVLANPADAAAGPTFTVDDMRFVFRRRKIDFLEVATGLPPAGVTNAIGRQIIAVDPLTGTITIDAALVGGTTTANTRIYNTGSRNAEIVGLDAAVFNGNPAVGNYLEIDASSATGFVEWQGVVDVSGGPITDVKVQSLARQIYQACELDDQRFLGITTPVLRDGLIAQLQQDRRFTGEEALSPNAGFQGVKWNGSLIAMDNACQAGRLYLLDLSYWREYQMADWDFMEADGSRLLRDPQFRDAYVWTLYKYSTPACMRRNAQGRLEGLTA